jgi:hypothetical protein
MIFSTVPPFARVSLILLLVVVSKPVKAMPLPPAEARTWLNELPPKASAFLALSTAIPSL